MNKLRKAKRAPRPDGRTARTGLVLYAMLAAPLLYFMAFDAANAATADNENVVDPVADPAESALRSPSPADTAPQPVSDLAAEQAQNASQIKRDELEETLAAQRDQLDQLQKQIEAQRQQALEQQKNIDAQTALLDSMQRQLDELAQAAGKPREPTESELKMREQLAGLQKQLAQIPEDPSASMAGADFPGSLRVPGTDVAFKIGGFAKTNLVKTFDLLGTNERFIVGSIPVDEADAAFIGSDTHLTAAQTRLNFEVRQKTSIGQLRGFVEGDFAGSGDSFRLRHAYGQYRDVLVGKTWSVFYDPIAQPEEVDFEGINGIVNLRQAQVRYFPAIGKSWELAVSLEDPVSEVADAINDSEIPDLVASVRHKRFGLGLRSAIVVRRLGAISTLNDRVEDSTLGYGFNIGGRIDVTKWDEHDNIKFEFVLGRGIGRYINDTNSLGGLDAVFDPSGTLKALPIWAANIAFQHWWSPTLRSTFLYSVVNIDTHGFQPGNAYAKTERATANLLWSPIPRVDVGGELLHGRRTNKDGSDGSAGQLQLQAKFRF